MFLYITGVKDENEVLAAIKNGANAIGVELGYRKSALEAEDCRTWLEELPFYLLKAGIFQNEEYYEVEEMASFCHLDIIHLTSTAKAKDFSRHSGRVIYETDITGMDGIEADGYIIRLSSVAEAKELSAKFLAKPILLTGEFNVSEWQQIFAYYEPVGIAIDYAGLNDELKKIINNR